MTNVTHVTNVIDLLSAQHRRMFEVLDALEAEVAKLERDEPLTPYVIDNALEFIAAYPDRFHRPLEQRVYRLLAANDGAEDESATAAAAAEQEHPVLTRKVGRVIDLLRATRRWPLLPQAPLIDAARSLVAGLRAHMTFEEETILPRIRRVVSAVQLEAAWEAHRRATGAKVDEERRLEAVRQRAVGRLAGDAA